jgi:HSP20 family protein
MASPGHKKEDFNIFLEKDLLTISLEEKETENQENNNFTRQEFRAYSFKRSFNLPENSDLSSIHAEYHDGILKVGINKKPEVKPELKKVEIS